jgi:hypothetical protein
MWKKKKSSPTLAKVPQRLPRQKKKKVGDHACLGLELNELLLRNMTHSCKLLQTRTIHHRGFSNHCQLRIYWQLSGHSVEPRLQSELKCRMQVPVHLFVLFLALILIFSRFSFAPPQGREKKILRSHHGSTSNRTRDSCSNGGISTANICRCGPSATELVHTLLALGIC